MQINDVFISYGRAESKAFAIKLHDRLVEKGYDIWFDQNDIPLGVDFQNQIDSGIENADNFVFVIAPHSVKSIYCLKEIELAISLKKRIIPILHIEPTTKEVWDKMHPTIGKINWIYSREKFEAGKPLEELENIDDFEAAFGGLISLIEKHKPYVKNHTVLLTKALEWNRGQQNPMYLLSGKNRFDAEKWLSTEFKTEQAPCEPTDLHCEFITESVKQATNMMTMAFFSYARENAELRDLLRGALTRKGITTWTDTSDIKSGETFEEAILHGIEQADNFLYLITPKSVVSKYCLMELDHVLKLNKRIIPMLFEEVPDDEIPESVRSLQYIDFRDKSEEGFSKSFDKLMKELLKDKDYMYFNKELLVTGLRWQLQKQNPSILLRGYKLEAAESWLKVGLKRNAQTPIEIHKEFISASVAKSRVENMHDVFISYSKDDLDFSRQLNDNFQTQGKDTWFDKENIVDEEELENEVNKGIENADNFIIIESPNYFGSEQCRQEIAYANKLGKRAIALKFIATDTSQLSPALQTAQSVDFRVGSSDFGTSFSELIRDLDTDREHVTHHTKFSKKALEWEKSEKSSDMLIRGAEYTLAETWMNEADDENKQPPITELQRDFFEESRVAIIIAAKRKKRRAAILRLLLIVMSVLFVIAAITGAYAYIQKGVAEANAIEAIRQKGIALENEKEALKQKQIADEKKREALRLKKIAEENEAEANRQRQKALENEREALRQKGIAETNEKEAIFQKSVAEMNEKLALTAKAETDLANARALYHLYVFNSKEFANNSLMIEENDDLRSLLAVTAFQLQDTASEKRPEEVSASPSDPRLLSAMQQAYIQYVDDNLKNGEYWALDSRNGFLAMSDTLGRIVIGQLDNSNDPVIPVLREVKSFVLASNAFVLSLAFSPDATQLVCGTATGSVILFDLKDNTQTEIYNHNNSSVLSIAFDKKGKRLVSSSANFSVKVWDMQSKTEIVTFENTQVINSLIITDDDYLMATDEIGNILQWNLATIANNSKAQTLQTTIGRLFSLAYNPVLKWLLSGSNKGKIRVSRRDKLDAIESFTIKHKGIISDICFSPDNHWVASASLDGTVLLWDLQNFKYQGVDKFVPIRIDNNGKQVLSVQFSSDSKFLIFGDNSKLHIRPLSSGDLYLGLLEKLNGKKMTDDQWQYYKKGDLKKTAIVE